jgi:hypothetical protein
VLADVGEQRRAVQPLDELREALAERLDVQLDVDGLKGKVDAHGNL